MDIILQRSTICADVHQTFKVKSKGRKNSKRNSKTPLLSLAKAEQNFAFQLPTNKIRVNDKAGLKELQGDNSNIIGYNSKKEFRPLKKISRRVDVGTADKDILNNVNHLLRQVLLFAHGNNMDLVYKSLKLAGKPVTFNVLTKVKPAYLIDNTKELHLQDERVLYLHHITVKKIWLHANKVEGNEVVKRVGEKITVTTTNTNISYDILFCSKVCTSVNIWLRSLNLDL